MSRPKLAMIICFQLSLTTLAFGQELLNEESIIELALKRNEVSAITKNQIEQGEYKVKQARSYMYPTLKANASISKLYLVPEKRLPGGIEMRSGEITLSQPIFTFGRLSSGIKIAKFNNTMTQNNAKATIAEIVKTSKQLFYTVAYSKNILKIAEQSLANANSNKNALEGRVAFGRINQNDNLKMQADVASRKPLLMEATKNYESSLQDLSAFLDLPVDQISSIDNDLTDKESTPLLNKPVDNFVDVANAVNQNKLTAAQEQLAKNDYMPTLSAYASYLPKHSPTNLSLPGVLLVDTAQIGLRLDFEFPLGGGKVYEKKVKTIDRLNAELNLRQVKRQTTVQQSSLIQQYENLNNKKEAIDEAVKLAERSYKVALRSFKNGSVSQLQLNDSELLLTNNKVASAQNLLQMKLLKAELERLQTEGRVE